MKYFLKQCGFQELGSVIDNGKAQRGRYLLVSMNDAVLSLFPPLSKHILNDFAVLPIISLRSGEKTYCNYVYHNDKFNGSTAKHKRNEYRIYLNNELEEHKHLFEVNDLLVMRSENIESSDIGETTIYYLDLLKNHNSGDYITLSRAINASPIRGSYAVYDGYLDAFEKKVERIKTNQYVGKVIIDDSVIERIRKSPAENKENLFNTATFRDFVLAGYGNACAVTGKVTNNVFETGIDVIYIKPRSVGGSCLPSNGIALSKMISMQFVEGMFSLNDNYEIIVHPKCTDKRIIDLNHRQIRVPPNAFFQPSKENMEYHRDNIYGTFCSKEFSTQ